VPVSVVSLVIMIVLARVIVVCSTSNNNNNNNYVVILLQFIDNKNIENPETLLKTGLEFLQVISVEFSHGL
jgi:hypothetical protein